MDCRSVHLRLSFQSCHIQNILDPANLKLNLPAVSGTPLQNDVGELANLLSFLLPNLFSEEAARLEERAAADGEEEAAALADRMQRLLEPFILRWVRLAIMSLMFIILRAGKQAVQI